MARCPKTYFRTERLTHALSLKEVADMIGLCKSAICKHELDSRPVSARLIIAGEVIFGKRAAELFPAFYKEVQDRIGRGAVKLSRRLEGKSDKASAKKRKLIARIPERSTPIDV